MDSRLHYLQGKTERVKPAELVAFLQTFYREKEILQNRHEAGARFVPTYERNNLYQYILARESMHLAWLRAAIEELGGSVPRTTETPPVPPGRGDAAHEQAILDDDRRLIEAFVARWRPRLGEVTHARHRRLLGLILGEMQEHQRLLEHGLAGRSDVLGRRDDVARVGGRVLARRWVE